VVQYAQADAPKVEQGANFILDVSHPSCNIEYNIPSNDKGIDRATVTATLPFDVRFFQMWGHIHLAGYVLRHMLFRQQLYGQKLQCVCWQFVSSFLPFPVASISVCAFSCQPRASTCSPP
jgi:hypothetical protein